MLHQTCLLSPHSNPSWGTSQLPQSCTVADICAGDCLASWVENCLCPWLAVWLACHRNWMTVMWPLTCSHSCLIAAPARRTTNGKLPIPPHLMHLNASGDRKEGKTRSNPLHCSPPAECGVGRRAKAMMSSGEAKELAKTSAYLARYVVIR